MYCSHVIYICTGVRTKRRSVSRQSAVARTLYFSTNQLLARLNTVVGIFQQMPAMMYIQYQRSTRFPSICYAMLSNAPSALFTSNLDPNQRNTQELSGYQNHMPQPPYIPTLPHTRITYPCFLATSLTTSQHPPHAPSGPSNYNPPSQTPYPPPSTPHNNTAASH